MKEYTTKQIAIIDPYELKKGERYPIEFLETLTFDGINISTWEKDRDHLLVPVNCVGFLVNGASDGLDPADVDGPTVIKSIVAECQRRINAVRLWNDFFDPKRAEWHQEYMTDDPFAVLIATTKFRDGECWIKYLGAIDTREVSPMQ